MGKKNRQKFTDVWANQTTLGKQFGLSAPAMGKKLKESGLPESGPESPVLSKTGMNGRSDRGWLGWGALVVPAGCQRARSLMSRLNGACG